ncbi:MAG: FAD-dependent oxidoreductase, partial [Chloroflexota bacterium]|nr:FAD-dependent oxidoreductase [Chloroflexota bacterium]
MAERDPGIGTGKHIAVIGGGMAGLTAAYRLAKAGHRVTLWERGEKLGGQAVAFPVAGSALEHFYHHLFQSDRDIAALMEELGIGDDLLWIKSNVGYFADGRIWPLNGALDVLRLGFIPFRDRVRLGLVTVYLQRVKDWKRFERITAHQWLERALGKRAYDRTLGAQLRAKFGSYHDQVAMVWFWG